MRTLPVCALVLTLAACGGGGGGDSSSTVTMLKGTGALQCSGGGTSLTAMQGQLTGGGVQVLAASCGTDGLDHPAVCGTADGSLGLFDIPASEQSAAEALGFGPVSSLPTAVPVACKAGS